ncbi:MAG TPA: BTAD domain-containing putative transcriptional regulator [Pseudonocardiaceae bacterium]|jgi:DNA-binding SARP family transcriptional activator/tetratricopeptide (TPR) repeat protein|nr:BTAD domain-containing putative transcriptional regulator [Pseudonocardiaceae bacterium]
MSADSIEFRLFGGIEAYRAGQPVDIGHARQQCVLAVLLVEANTAVSADELIDRVWGGAAPSGKGSLYSYLTRLRRALPEISIVRRGSGYSLVVDPDTIDLHVFRRLSRTAHEADDATAEHLLGEGLALWRGEPFAGQDNPWLNSVRAVLDTERSSAELDRADHQLRLGRHNEILPTLATFAGKRPLDERVAGQLMLALYRAGRQADALNHYQRTRTQLADELGIDPSPALRDLHQQILTADPKLTTVAPEPAATSPVPRQLPAAPRSFSGRMRELDSLTSVLDLEAMPNATVVISAIGGTGGIGKTWLALHWAHQNLDRFPDGQLFVNLRGFDPSGKPTAPSDAIRGFLDTLGVEPSAIPTALDAQTALYRSLIADKRMLIVLDNAADPTQVIPLLPGSPTCTVIVTSRDRLVNLVNAHGAQPLPLDALTETEARTLLASRLGAERLAREPEAVNDLITSCAGLPLALSIVAGRALEHPDFPLSELAEELHDTENRLATLDEDPSTSVSSVLSWSYAALTQEQARVFSLIGLAPGPDISLAAAANLTGRTENRIRAELRALERVSLVQQQVPGRYRMHDLVRLYALHKARSLPTETGDAALRVLADFYAHTALAADRQLAPARKLADLYTPSADCHPLPISDVTTARDWFSAEYDCLSLILPIAVERRWHEVVWLLAAGLINFRWRQGKDDDDAAAWHAALTAARNLGNRDLECSASRRLGHAYSRAGRFDEAVHHLQESLELCEQDDNPAEQAHTHMAMMQNCERSGDHQQAIHHARQARVLYLRVPGGEVWAGQSLNAIGWFHAVLGQYEEGRIACEAALEVTRAHYDPEGQADCLDSLGYIAHHGGQYELAVSRYQEALAIFRGLGHVESALLILEHLWQSHLAMGDLDRTRAVLNEVLRTYQERRRTADAERIRAELAKLDANPVPQPGF